MTSSALEKSWRGGRPVMFFRFTRGHVEWRYTNSDRPEIHNEQIYQPAAIKRGRVRQGAESGRQGLVVTLPSTLAVADNWRPYPPSQAIVLTVFVRHVGETDTLADWIGRVVAPKFNGGTLELTCEPSGASGEREGALRIHQRGCDVPLYSTGRGMCNLDPEPVPVPAVLTAVAGSVLTAPGFLLAPRTLAGGTLTWLGEDEEIQSRQILAHTGDQITLDTGAEDLAVDLAVTATTLPLWVETTISAVSGLTLTAPALAGYPAGWFAGGYIQWPRVADGLIEYRSITKHVGTEIDLYYGALDLAPGLIVRAYPGCAHTWAACGARGNRANYGGDLWTPLRSPYDGHPIW